MSAIERAMKILSKQKLMPGDRVAVYSVDGRSIGTLGGEYGHSLFLFVPDKDIHSVSVAHIKQCRRLVKKQSRSVWITEQDLERIANGPTTQASVPVSFIKKVQSDVEFREVKRK